MRLRHLAARPAALKGPAHHRFQDPHRPTDHWQAAKQPQSEPGAFVGSPPDQKSLLIYLSLNRPAPTSIDSPPSPFSAFHQRLKPRPRTRKSPLRPQFIATLTSCHFRHKAQQHSRNFVVVDRLCTLLTGPSPNLLPTTTTLESIIPHGANEKQ